MDISNTTFIHGAQGLQGMHRNVAARDSMSGVSQRGVIQDEVSFSADAVRMSDSIPSGESSSSGVRFELVNRIRAEIAAGTYDTGDKLDIALDRMIERTNPR